MKKRRLNGGEEHNADGSNMLEMPGTRKKSKAPEDKNKNEAPKISKNMQRKLKKIQEEKEKREMRIESLEMLQKHRLSENAQALIRSSSTLGKTETMREKLRRGMQLKTAGLDIPSDIPLIRERNVSMEECVEDEEEDNKVKTVNVFVKSSKVVATTERTTKKRKLTPTNKAGEISIVTPEVSKQSLRTNGMKRPEQDTEELETDESAAVPKENDNTTAQGKEELVKESEREKNATLRSVENNTTLSGNGEAAGPKFFVSVWRSEEVENSRSNLPIIMMEQEIMEALHENDVVIICGETGCGKTTQVPQFLYEAGYGSQLCKGRSGVIGITQPRRIAVLTTAKRVAHELNLQLGKEVGFQVRYDRNIGEKSCMKFMTDGILLREIQSDFLLSRYSVIVLDEAHERSVNTDILIGMLSRVLPLRNKLYQENCKKKKCLVMPLKLIIMSATLRVEDFTANQRMFSKPPPVIQVSARQFPVTVHSSRKTEIADYESAAYRKVCAIHRKLPPGGILVFLTGRREVESLCKRLKLSFSPVQKPDEAGKKLGNEFGTLNMDTLAEAIDEHEEDDPQFSDSEEEEKNMEESDKESDVSDIEEGKEIASAADANKDGPKKPGPAHILPLYAMLPAAAQLKVFAEVPEGKRLIVVATNVAETSITIPGIRYVVDCGRAKERKFYGSSGVSKFEVCWISKASADQRAGRAGRTGPGHCYQLYSRTHYHNNFLDFAPPEISLVPIEGVVLMLKCMGIDKVVNFPFPTPPEKQALIEAEKCLMALSALDRITGLPTPTGKAMSRYPMNPRHARMLIAALHSANQMKSLSRKCRIIAYAVAMAAALSVENPFMQEVIMEETDNSASARKEVVSSKAAHAKFRNTSSDALTTLKALNCYEQSRNRVEFCKENHLNEKIMKEMTKLHLQLSRLVRQELEQEVSTGLEEAWKEFSTTQLSTNDEKVLLHALCAGWPDRIAKRVTRQDRLFSDKTKKRGVRYQAGSVEDFVYLNPTSSTCGFASDYVVYKEIVHTSRPYMACVSSVDIQCLVMEAGYLCTFSKPLEDPPPYYDREADQVKCYVSASFGPRNWELPLQSVVMETGRKRTAVFALALLQGQVVPSFGLLRSHLAADPAVLLKPESFVHKRVADLVYKLGEGGSTAVDTRRKLAEAWESDGKFLYEELSAWLQSKHRDLLKTVWENIQMESKLVGKQLFKTRR